MKNSTYIKYVSGEASELDKRILVRDVGYEIVISAKGYILEDKSGIGDTISNVFETIDEIVEHLEPKLRSEYGDSLSKDQWEQMRFESKIQIVTAGIIEDGSIFNTVRQLAQETKSDFLPSYSEDPEVDGFQVGVGFRPELELAMKNEILAEDIGIDAMETLLKELAEAEKHSLDSIDVRMSK